jgi:hypothetical protein
MGQKPTLPTDPTRTPLVIGAGLLRTGTVSFSLALEKLLHGPVYHSGTSVLLLPEGCFLPYPSPPLHSPLIVLTSTRKHQRMDLDPLSLSLRPTGRDPQTLAQHNS